MTWELVAVARTAQAAAPPTLTEIDAIVAPAASWAENLERPEELRFSCQVDRLPADVKARLRELDDAPTEVWLYRDDDLQFAGPITGYQIQGGTLSAYCTDVLGYLASMLVHADATFAGADQFAIVAALIDQWQDLPYGHFGIDTSAVGTSGVTRDATYLAAEQHQVLQRVLELGNREDGFDIHVTPDRLLVLSHPERGADLSDEVVLDSRNITDGSLSVSVADLASEAYGTGTSADGPPLTSLQSDTARRAAYGRTAAAETFDGVSQQATLDDHTAGLLARRHSLWYQPGAGLRPVADVDVDSFHVGDVVAYVFDHGLGEHAGEYRVATKQVSIDAAGQEAIAVEFQ